MTILIIFIVLIILVFIIKKYFPDAFLEEKKIPYKYRRKDFLMSRAEHEFFNILVEVLENQYYIFPQIHLSDILDHKVVGQNWKGAFRHINEKSVDYVLCDKSYIKPLLAIELDDNSHQQERRKERDGEVERILGNAGIPLFRLKNHGNFNKEEIRRSVLEKLK